MQGIIMYTHIYIYGISASCISLQFKQFPIWSDLYSQALQFLYLFDLFNLKQKITHSSPNDWSSNNNSYWSYVSLLFLIDNLCKEDI